MPTSSTQALIVGFKLGAKLEYIMVGNWWLAFVLKSIKTPHANNNNPFQFQTNHP